MKKIIILTSLLVLIAGISITFAKNFRWTPGQHSSAVFNDGHSSTPYDWECWIDRTNSIFRCSSCRVNGGYACPSEEGWCPDSDYCTPFNEEQGLPIGP